MRETIPLISVITPCFNADQTLAASIDSVLSQTYTKWEHLIVDDGSTDGTWDIAKAYSARDTRILCSRQERRGVSAARNYALTKVQGEYIALLDSDDECLPTRLAAQLEYLLLNPAVDVVGSSMIDVDPESGAEIGISRATTTHATLIRELRYRCPFFASTVMARRAFFEGVGGFDVRVPRSEDYDLWLRGITGKTQRSGAFLGALKDAPEHDRRLHNGASYTYGNVDLPLVRYRRKMRPSVSDGWYSGKAVWRHGLRHKDLLALSWYSMRPLLVAIVNWALYTACGKTPWRMKQ